MLEQLTGKGSGFALVRAARARHVDRLSLNAGGSQGSRDLACGLAQAAGDVMITEDIDTGSDAEMPRGGRRHGHGHDGSGSGRSVS